MLLSYRILEYTTRKLTLERCGIEAHKWLNIQLRCTTEA